MEQLKLAVTSVELELTEEMMKDIEAVHLAAPNICP
jgi:aryl-alcohol dehydrogenase-like predicted oxidoreductase